MSKQVSGNQKHMTLDNRVDIEKGLDVATSLRQIAIHLHKDPSTITKEIRKHRTLQPHNSFNEGKNKCSLRATCKRKNICDPDSHICNRLCASCARCNDKCIHFVPITYHCNLLDNAPFVCNGCKKKTGCRLDKYYYRSTTAHRQYRTVLADSRAGINISQADLTILDELISPLIARGQSPFMILQNHPEITLSEKTIYNYIGAGALTVKNIDLYKKVKYKIRNVAKSQIKDAQIFVGRSYKDYCNFLKEYPDTNVVEMDTVVGCEGSHKVLLTLHFVNCHFMMAFLLSSKESKQVLGVFNHMEARISTILFNHYLPLILTDRGTEFSNPDALEGENEKPIRTSIYYCDPMASWQKPHCEKNHEYIRMICPKGTSFDSYTQADINWMMSHINCASRESINGLTPLKLASLMLPPVLLDFSGVKEIEPENVMLKPALLKNRSL